jgi:hypothetical protein
LLRNGHTNWYGGVVFLLKKGQTKGYVRVSSISSFCARAAMSGVEGRDSSNGLGGQNSGAPQLVTVDGVAGALPKARSPMSGLLGRYTEAGVAGHTDGAPQDVAVVGVFGTLINARAAISGDGIRVTLAGVVGQESGAPHEAIVEGVAGESSTMRAAISGDGNLDTLENAGVARESSGPKEVATDGVNITEPSMRRSSPIERRGSSNSADDGHSEGGPADDIDH